MQPHIKSIEFYKGVTIIRVVGSVTFENLKDVQDEYRAKMEGREVKNILFDVKNVTDADSSGIAALIELFKYMKTHQAGERVGLINLSKKMKDLLEVSKTKELFREYSSEEKAIKDLE